MSHPLNGVRHDFNPSPGLVALIFFPPLVYAASSWWASRISQRFEACAPGGIESLFAGTHPQVQAASDSLAGFFSSLFIITWMLAWLMPLLIHTLAAIQERFACALREMVERSVLIYSMLALSPLLTHGLACIV